LWSNETTLKNTNLTVDEVESFQSHIHAFYVLCVNLTRHKGITNFIHMLASGHISEYILYWGNLYDHSQQGWEAFKSLIKTFFFCRTGQVELETMVMVPSHDCIQ